MVLEEVFRRTKIPDVLILLLLGIGLSASGTVDAQALAGGAQVFTTAALVLILFEGAVRLKLSELRVSLGGATLLTFSSFFASTAAVGLAGWALFGLPLLPALLLGTIVAGTSSAVVIPMVQTLSLSQETRTVLTLESALSDVLCIVFAIALVTGLSAGEVSGGAIARDLVIGFGGALVLGGVAGFGWAIGLRALRSKRASLVLVGAAVFLVYAVTEALGLFGAIAVLSFGVVQGNAEHLAKDRPYAEELGLSKGERIFLAEMAFILKVFFFVYLGISLELKGWQPLLFGTIASVALFAVRPLTVRVSMRPPTTSRPDAVVASTLIPKGLAAAVLAAVPVQAGLAEGPLIRNITFGVILISIVAGSVLTYFSESRFVAGAYSRLFKSYPESVDDEETETVVAESPEGEAGEETDAQPEAKPAAS